MIFSGCAKLFFATTVVSAALSGVAARRCGVKVCNRTPSSWLKLGEVASENLDGYSWVGGVKKNECKTIQHDASGKLLKADRGNNEFVGLFEKRSCGCTYDICGHKVVNRSSRPIEAWIPGLMADGVTKTHDIVVPIKINPGQWKVVVGGKGEPIVVQDVKTKFVYKKFRRAGCDKTVVVRDIDCVGPKPTVAPTDHPTASPTTTPTTTPTGYPVSLSSVATRAPVSLRSNGKCEPECGSLRGCYLFDFTLGSEIPLVVEDPTEVFNSHAMSVRCEVDSPIGFVEFVGPDGAVMHGGEDAPYWIMGHNPVDGSILHMPPLGLCESSEFSVRGFLKPSGGGEACFEESFVLESDCTEPPTNNPTATPTTAPTVSPTASPTAGPSPSPTASPTSLPTLSPTKNPTVEPTMSPSKSPTKSPTAGPTSSPSRAPTAKPTASPTESPTNAPTSSPSASPTKTPTQTRSAEKPTLSPTAAPLPSPTASPTCVHGDTPTTIRDGKKPTVSPTKAPTNCKVPHHPRMCYLWSSTLRYWDPVPKDTNIEIYTYHGKKFQFNAVGPKATFVKNIPYQKFHSKPFYVRFSNSCGSSLWTLCKNYTPIGLDIDHSGAVEHITGEFKIDITGDGETNELQEWFAPTEGILIDTNHDIENGIITGQHLFGDQGGTYSDGFEKLEQHDDNSDGIIQGQELEGFMIWTDSNSNTILDDGELSTLASHGIVSLATMHDDMVSHATLEDGSKMRMEDLWFSR